MRDLKIEEIGHIYGATGSSCAPPPPCGCEPAPKGSKAKGSKGEGGCSP